jgi:hypothetical protein
LSAAATTLASPRPPPTHAQPFIAEIMPFMTAPPSAYIVGNAAAIETLKKDETLKDMAHFFVNA